MTVKYQVDAIDQKILYYLVKNARIPFLEIARECGISGAAIHQRVKKMEEAGIIVGSQLIVRPKSLGFDLCAFVGVTLVQLSMYNSVVEQLTKISEVVECHFVTGAFAMLVKVYCHDNSHLMEVLVSTIQNIPGVSKTETWVSLNQAISRQIYVLDKRVSRTKKIRKGINIS
ncbi:MAG: Lrp/AsnC ligand binding domain-containing protein [Prevotellaceae bacterium]|jgi:Lrp/AsnC family transcriptional regulator for asnA, asnC and gidA|nr:Lrp/AsnC ligand binding domain-containing protein [Prevotellaceae bacterium]